MQNLCKITVHVPESSPHRSKFLKFATKGEENRTFFVQLSFFLPEIFGLLIPSKMRVSKALKVKERGANTVVSGDHTAQFLDNFSLRVLL